MSSSSWTGGLPDRRQTLEYVSAGLLGEASLDLLFVKQVPDPEDTLALFGFHRI